MACDSQKYIFDKADEEKSTRRDYSIWLGISGLLILYHISKMSILQIENLRGRTLF